MRGSYSTNPAAFPRASPRSRRWESIPIRRDNSPLRAAAFLAPRAATRRLRNDGQRTRRHHIAVLRFGRPGSVDVSVRPSSGGRLGRDWVDANRSFRVHPAVRLLRRSSVVLSGCLRPHPGKRHGVCSLVRARPPARGQRPVGTGADSAAADAVAPRKMASPRFRNPSTSSSRPADMGATARVMRDRGAPLLIMSNNYYEDLYARFALHPVSSSHARVRHSLRSRGRRRALSPLHP